MTTMIDVNALVPALSLDADNAPQVTDSAAEFELRQVELRIAVRQMLAVLAPREEEVVRWLFGIDRERATVRETAKFLGIAPSTVAKISAAAVNKLRNLC